MDGTTTIRVWVRADFRLVAYLAVYLTVVTPDLGTLSVGRGFNDTVVFDTRAKDANYLLGVSNFTVPAGSTLQLHAKLTTTDRVTGVYLLYDDPTTPTQMTISARGILRDQFTLNTSAGISSRVFEINYETGNATVVAHAEIADAIGLYRLATALFEVSDSNGVKLLSLDLLGQPNRERNFTTTATVSLNLPEGVYSIALSISDRAGATSGSSEQFYVTPFYNAEIRVLDSSNRPLSQALVVASTAFSNYTGYTNQTGWATIRLPPSRIVGLYQVTVLWNNLTLLSAGGLPVARDMVVSMVVTAYDLAVNVKMLGFDVPGARVELTANSSKVLVATTNSSGAVIFTDLPPGNYQVKASYLGSERVNSFSVDRNTSQVIDLPLPYQEQIPLAVILIVAVAAVSTYMRRKRVYESPFEFLGRLTKGGIPDSCSVAIIGDSGSGKTVLMECLAQASLREGRGCVYVTNVDLPVNIRRTMEERGTGVEEYESQRRLIFIDSYSTLSGARSKEHRSVSSITDLTGLGVLISTSMEEVGSKTDVFLDSLNPLFTALKTDYVITFLQSIGAKVKANNGRFFVTVGSSLEKAGLTKVEEVSDCVIETQLVETRAGQKRRMRVKKLRAHPYIDAWTGFKVNETGITFLTNKPYKQEPKKPATT